MRDDNQLPLVSCSRPFAEMADFAGRVETRLLFLRLRRAPPAVVPLLPTEQSSAHALSLEQGSLRQPEILWSQTLG